jgi:hypothetical protein
MFLERRSFIARSNNFQFQRSDAMEAIFGREICLLWRCGVANVMVRRNDTPIITVSRSPFWASRVLPTETRNIIELGY